MGDERENLPVISQKRDETAIKRENLRFIYPFLFKFGQKAGLEGRFSRSGYRNPQFSKNKREEFRLICKSAPFLHFATQHHSTTLLISIIPPLAINSRGRIPGWLPSPAQLQSSPVPLPEHRFDRSIRQLAVDIQLGGPDHEIDMRQADVGASGQQFIPA